MPVVVYLVKRLKIAFSFLYKQFIHDLKKQLKNFITRRDCTIHAHLDDTAIFFRKQKLNAR